MEKNVPNWDLAFEILFYFIYLFIFDVPSLMVGDQGSLVGHGLRIMCGSDEKYKGS
jgi:hypothetical protein